MLSFFYHRRKLNTDFLKAGAHLRDFTPSGSNQDLDMATEANRVKKGEVGREDGRVFLFACL